MLTLLSCSKSHKDAATQGYRDGQSQYAGLAFTTVDTKFTASTLWYNNLATAELTTLSSGESGDPWLTLINHRIYLFNRGAASLNWRSFDVRSGEVARSPQIATAGAATGDPHDALLLSPHRLLLAHYNAGNLVVIDPDTGALTQTIAPHWDLGTNAAAQFHPEALYARRIDANNQEVYVLHQGVGSDFKADGSQQIFILKDDGQTVTPVDLGLPSAGASGIKGIALTINNPARFFTLSPAPANQVLVYGECTYYAAADCQQGFEQVDLAARTTTVLFQTQTHDVRGNGGCVKGQGNNFYALMTTPDGTTKTAAKLDLAVKAQVPVYNFHSASGCCGFAIDDSSDTLYIGDADSAADPGYFAVFSAMNAAGQAAPLTQPEAPTAVLSLPARPFSSVFFPK